MPRYVPSCLSANSFSIAAGSVPLRISGIRSATAAATSDFQSSSIRAVFSSRACLAPEVEPGRSHVGTVQRDEQITSLDVLSENRMNLADHTRGARSNVDPAIGIDLDPARDP